MILTAVSASDIKKSSCSSDPNSKNAHKFAMINAVVMGIIVFVVAFTMIMYIVYSNREAVGNAASKTLNAGNAAYSAFFE
jgi:heme/copper-type cytochrome/quinol oxidase subunit 2